MHRWLIEKLVRGVVPALLGAVVALLLAAGLIEADLAAGLQDLLSGS